MKVIALSVIAALVLGLGAALALRSAQRPAYEVYSTSSTRLSDPGDNLVGKTWNGLNEERKG